MESSTSELLPSELGTKEYWDSSYETEIKNFNSHGDCGEIWFDESSQFRVIKWMSQCDEIQSSDSILDLGELHFLFLISLSSFLSTFRHWQRHDAD